MRVSVIVPSRLARNIMSATGNLWLDRALMSIVRQTVRPWEVIVGLDAGAAARVPPRFLEGPVRFVESGTTGQAAAVNAAAREARGELLAFLEDDDQWEPRFLETALEALADRYDFVTSNNREIDESGSFVRYNDFPTPSGWLINADAWRDLGGLDESFRWHVDTDFLGKANREKLRRAHLVETGAGSSGRPWLEHVARRSEILEHDQREPLVIRCVNPFGGMSTIARGGEAAAQSSAEHQRMFDKYGEIPW